MKPSIEKTLGIGAITLAFALGTASTARADEVHECATAYEQTQRFQQKNELLSALDAAERCSKPACPALLTTECTKWAADLRNKLPSLVLHVRGGDGCSLAEASVTVDGPTRRGEASALLIDPGAHEVTVVDPKTNQSRKETLNMGPGEKRDIDVNFAPPGAVCPRPSEPTPFGRVPTISLIAVSVGAGFVLLGAGLGIVGASKRGDLDDCKPTCSNDRVDAVRPFFVAGDVIAGVGLAAIAVGAISYFMLQPSSSRRKTTAGWYWTPNGAGASF